MKSAPKPDTKRRRPVRESLTTAFSQFAQRTSALTGHPLAFLLAFLVVVTWIISGPLFGYSDTWQLVINTGTTIVTFLMVFLIQNTQNRDIMTLQLKLSELVVAMKGAEDKFASVEDLSDEELEDLHHRFSEHADLTLHHLKSRQDKDTGARKSSPAPRNGRTRRKSRSSRG